MTWIEGSLLLFGGLVAVMGLGLPVAFAFLALNVVGALLFLGGEPGLAQLARNAVQSITSFSLTPIPFFVLMGEVLFHTGVALKAIDAFALLIRRVPGRLVGHRHRRRHGVLGDLGLDHRHHRAARQPDAADHAGARLRAAHGDGPDHGHRRRRHADPAVGAHRAARQPRRHLDRRPADRRHRAGPDPERRCSSATSSCARACDPALAPDEPVEEGPPGLARWRAVRHPRAAAPA